MKKNIAIISTIFLLVSAFAIAETRIDGGLVQTFYRLITSTLTVKDDLTVTDDASVGGDLAVTGCVSAAKLTGSGTSNEVAITSSTTVTASASTVLTGSIDPTASTSVTGVDTLFTTELNVGDSIEVSGETRVVVAIASDTELTVRTAFTDTANDTTPTRIPAQITSSGRAGTTNFIVSQDGDIVLSNGTYFNSIVNSAAEGLSGTDLRIGLGPVGQLVLCPNSYLATDFGLAGTSFPTLTIVSNTGAQPLKINSIKTVHSSGSGYNFNMAGDVVGGNAFGFGVEAATNELTDSDGRQAFVGINAAVKQSGTAAFDALYVNIADSESYGDGSTGDGNNIINAAVAGASKFRVDITGKMIVTYGVGKTVETFNGTTDTDITGIILYNADGEACYVYPNATQDGIVVSASIP